MSEKDALSKEDVESCCGLANKVLEQLDKTLLGREKIHKLILTGLLSEGHILLEGLPGLGKTMLVKTLSELLHLSFNRIQFTPDLMPGDIIGNQILQETESGGRDLVFRKGPVFANIILADEINRASAKTQSALLEAMQERTITAMGETMRLPLPFMVMATQNPIELEGTFPLPEAQLDRFLFKIPVDHVDASVLQKIISTRRRGEPPKIEWTLGEGELKQLLDAKEKVFLPDPVSSYIARLVSATHPGNNDASSDVKEYVTHGASPRAAIALAESARVHALIAGSPSAGFEDVKAVAPYVLNHRLILNYKSKYENINSWDVIDGLLNDLKEAQLSLPDNIKVAR